MARMVSSQIRRQAPKGPRPKDGPPANRQGCDVGAVYDRRKKTRRSPSAAATGIVAGSAECRCSETPRQSDRGTEGRSGRGPGCGRQGSRVPTGYADGAWGTLDFRLLTADCQLFLADGCVLIAYD